MVRPHGTSGVVAMGFFATNLNFELMKCRATECIKKHA